MAVTPARRGNPATDIALIAAFAALIAACALLPAIPIAAGVPFTLQTFAVVLTGAVLGAKRGFLAALLYLAVGLIGIPVFAGASVRPRPVRRRDRRLPDLVPVRRRNRWLHRFAPASQEHRCQRGRLAARDPGRRDRQPPRRHHRALVARGHVALRGDVRRRRLLAHGRGEGTARGGRRDRRAPRVSEPAAPASRGQARGRGSTGTRVVSRTRRITA